MAVSVNWGSFFLGVLIMKALLFGVYVRAPDFWKLHNSLARRATWMLVGLSNHFQLVLLFMISPTGLIIKGTPIM